VTADRPLDLLPALRCPTRAAGRPPRLDARNERQHRPSPGCRQRRWRRTARRDRPVGRGRRRRAGVAGDSVRTVGTPDAECKCVFAITVDGARWLNRAAARVMGDRLRNAREGTVIEGARVGGAVGRPPGWETEWEVSAHRGRKPPTHSPRAGPPLAPGSPPGTATAQIETLRHPARAAALGATAERSRASRQDEAGHGASSTPSPAELDDQGLNWMSPGRQDAPAVALTA
jgi:hypothetical protein